MRKAPSFSVLIFLALVFTFTSCTPDNNSPATPTKQPPTESAEVPQAYLVITSAGLEWPDLSSEGPCVENSPSPTINLCIQNQGEVSGAAGFAYFALPSAFAPGIQANILSTLPGGNWKPAEFITIDGLPGADGSTQGIVIVNTLPGPDSGAQGIIIINGMPGPDSGAQGIIIINGMPESGSSSEGIIIVNGLPGADNINQVMGVFVEDKPGEDGDSQGIIIVDSMPGPDSGAQGIIIIDSMPGVDGSAEGS